jgi:lipopolysaccharide transport system permease protein
VTGTSRTFVANAGLLGKVYFHRLVIPVAIVLSNLISFAFQFAILAVAVLAYRLWGTPLHITAWAALVPLMLVMLAGYGLGVGIIVSALTTRYRDLSYLVTFGVQLLMYITPVIYPTSAVPAHYRWIVRANPLTPIVEGFRRGIVGVGTLDLPQLLMSMGLMLVVLALGLVFFTRVERTFMDTV